MSNEKIIMLGTGHGFTFDLYNTCFIIQNGDKNLLVDTLNFEFINLTFV